METDGHRFLRDKKDKINLVLSFFLSVFICENLGLNFFSYSCSFRVCSWLKIKFWKIHYL